jgi:uncharacterized membrane protein YgdD (TMEM256/DUF423 family)
MMASLLNQLTQAVAIPLAMLGAMFMRMGAFGQDTLSQIQMDQYTEWLDLAMDATPE